MKWMNLLMAALLLALGLSGCGSGGKTIKYDIPEKVQNLDPQFATSSTARMVIGNIYEGLVVLEADGAIVPGVAESYTISPDGLRYTFALRDGACWTDGRKITSEDFAFTFRRIFNSSAPSPYANEYTCIKNAREVLAGTQPFSALGIEIPDDLTVIFTLEAQTPFFLELLASTPAMPCNRDFFEDARGRYGLERDYIYSNGPFYLSKWDNTKNLTLLNNETYVSDKPVLATGVTLYIGREDPVEEFLDEKADLVFCGYEDLSRLPGDATLTSFDKTTWCLVFNQNDPVLGNALIRQSLAHALDDQSFAFQLPDGLTATRTFVPPAMLLLEQPYRDLAGSEPPITFNTQRASYLYGLGHSSLELKAFPSITMLVPDTDSHAADMAHIQQYWQRYLGIYINLEAMSPRELQQSFAQQRYQILLMPFSPSNGQVGSLLDAFTSTSSQNYTGYSNPRYDSLLQTAAEGDIGETAEKYIQAEALLLSDAVVIPVYFETTTYAVDSGMEGLGISPYSGRIYFKYARIR